MTLIVVPDPHEEMLELTKAIEAFHDVYAPDMPYAVVAALQSVLGYEAMERCMECGMRKYLIKDQVCASCRDEMDLLTTFKR